MWFPNNSFTCLVCHFLSLSACKLCVPFASFLPSFINEMEWFPFLLLPSIISASFFRCFANVLLFALLITNFVRVRLEIVRICQAIKICIIPKKLNYASTGIRNPQINSLFLCSLSTLFFALPSSKFVLEENDIDKLKWASLSNPQNGKNFHAFIDWLNSCDACVRFNA